MINSVFLNYWKYLSTLVIQQYFLYMLNATSIQHLKFLSLYFNESCSCTYNYVSGSKHPKKRYLFPLKPNTHRSIILKGKKYRVGLPLSICSRSIKGRERDRDRWLEAVRHAGQ